MSDEKSKEAKRQAYLARLKGEPVPSLIPETEKASTSTLVETEGPIVEIDDFQKLASVSPGEKISGFSGRVGSDTVKRIGEVVDDHPDKALAIFRAWMNQ